MKKTDDALRRARQALRRADAELDLDRVRSRALERSRTDLVTGSDRGRTRGVEIPLHGQPLRPPRRRTAVWALTASLALLGAAGAGAIALWPEPETLPGSPATVDPRPDPTLPTPTSPADHMTREARDCATHPPTGKDGCILVDPSPGTE